MKIERVPISSLFFSLASAATIIPLRWMLAGLDCKRSGTIWRPSPSSLLAAAVGAAGAAKRTAARGAGGAECERPMRGSPTASASSAKAALQNSAVPSVKRFERDLAPAWRSSPLPLCSSAEKGRAPSCASAARTKLRAKASARSMLRKDGAGRARHC